MVTTVVLVRHGQSTWNAEHRWQGQADPPLSAFGRSQALRAAGALASMFPDITAVVSSPQRRASETAQLLAAHPDLSPGPNDILFVPDLRERHVGPWSGLTRTEIDERFPGYLDHGLEPEGYEPDESVFARARRALQATADHAGRTTVLAVCHGGLIVTLVRRLTEERNRIPNLSGWTVEIGDGQIAMVDRFDLLPERERTGGDTVRF